jgi:hypothetical protein
MSSDQQQREMVERIKLMMQTYGWSKRDVVDVIDEESQYAPNTRYQYFCKWLNGKNQGTQLFMQELSVSKFPENRWARGKELSRSVACSGGADGHRGAGNVEDRGVAPVVAGRIRVGGRVVTTATQQAQKKWGALRSAVRNGWIGHSLHKQKLASDGKILFAGGSTVVAERHQEIEELSRTWLKEDGHLQGYQKDALWWMRRQEQSERYGKAYSWRGGILADDMGLGKTLTTLSLICSTVDEGPTLVVCPRPVVSSWAFEQRKKFIRESVIGADDVYSSHDANGAAVNSINGMGHRRAVRMLQAKRLVVVGRESACGPTATYTALSAVRWRRIVVDESHQVFSNETGRQFIRLGTFDVDPSVGSRWCLTGTPIKNNIDELFCQLRILKAQPYALGGLDFQQQHFEDGYPNPRSEKQVVHMLNDCMLHRTKEDVDRRHFALHQVSGLQGQEFVYIIGLALYLHRLDSSTLCTCLLHSLHLSLPLSALVSSTLCTYLGRS